jgi:hypothetical protein
MDINKDILNGMSKGTLEEKYNIKIFFPSMSQLTIDIDSTEAYNQFIKSYKILKKKKMVSSYIENDSITPDHKHIIVDCPNVMTFSQIVTLQLFLGSDCKRELYGISRYFQGDRRPFRLFTYKDIEDKLNIKAYSAYDEN